MSTRNKAEKTLGWNLSFPPWWAWLGGFIFFLFHLEGLVRYEGAAVLPDYAYAPWTLLVAWSLALFVTSLLSLWLKRPNPKLSGILFLLWTLMPLLGLQILGKERQFDFDQQWRKQMEETQIGLRRQEAIRAQQELDWIQSQRREAVDRYASYAGQIPRDALEAIRALDQQMQESLNTVRKVYRDALQTVPTAGPDSWFRVETVEGLEEIRVDYTRLYEASRMMLERMESFRSEYEEGIEELSLEESARRIAIAEMERIMQFWEYGGDLEIRRLDVGILKAALDAQHILIRSFDDWNYSPIEDQLRFDNEGTEARFMQSMQTMQIYTEEIDGILQKRESEIPEIAP